MAKKFGKFLMFTAVAGAIAAGAYYYLQNKNGSCSDDLDDDDFDDFSDEPDDGPDQSDSARNYVDLNPEKVENSVCDAASAVADEAKAVVKDAASAAGEVKTAVTDAVKDAAEAVESKVEEFFDDDEQ